MAASTRSATSGPVPAGTWPSDRCSQVTATYHGPRTRPRVGARERYHKLSPLVAQQVTYRDESHDAGARPRWSGCLRRQTATGQRIVATASGWRQKAAIGRTVRTPRGLCRGVRAARSPRCQPLARRALRGSLSRVAAFR